MAKTKIAKNTVTNEVVEAEVETISLDNHSEAAQVQVESQTKLEDDEGLGNAAVIRQFTFSMNLETFRNNPVSKQELFNHHLKQIEIVLWQDGLKILTEVHPQLQINAKKRQYTIIVGAEPAPGEMLHWNQKPKKLSELV